MSPQEWKTIGLFGAMLGVVSLFDGTAALWIGGAALLVIILRHPDVFTRWLP